MEHNQTDYESLPLRIKDIYDTCSPEEQGYLIQILQELSDTGTSSTYDNLWLQDYKEIPVDLDTFLCDDRYLGKTNREGEAIYPFWKTAMHDIFDSGNKYHECVFTGATRIGKTSTAITCSCYMLYRMMCLRDPQKFFNKKDVSKFSIMFFNITKDMAQGVAFREFNDTLKSSDWFQKHGTFSKSERNFYYIPEGGKIEIDYGSEAAHSIGKQIFIGFMDECITGDTLIVTDQGCQKIEDLVDQNIHVLAYNEYDYYSEFVDASVQLTRYVDTTYRLYLENGSYLECTNNHRLMLRDGRYKYVEELSSGDEIICLDSHLGDHLKVHCVEMMFHADLIAVYDVINSAPYHNFVCLTSDGTRIVSHNCNFARAGIKDVKKAKERMKELYDSVVARVEGTFRVQGEVWGKVFAVSSKKSDSDFMEDHVQSQLAAGNSHMIVFDKPQWEVLPSSQFNPERFWIAVGDRHRRGFVLTDESEEARKELRNQGYSLMQVPLDMKTNFLSDFDISLRDLAGIAVPGALSFITQEFIDLCTGDRHNPFYQEILEIGTRDTYTIEEFFHMELVDKNLMKYPMFIDVDLSLNDDKTGISGCAITGRTDIKSDDGKILSVPTFSHIFSIDIKAPRGDKIPYAKITAFILWLRRSGFDIERISRDQFQSEYMGQLLESEGFTVDKLSVDRTPDGYLAFRSLLLEQRIDLLPVQILQDELIHLQRDSITGRIDHPVGGAKDSADSVARCTWNAILHSDIVTLPRTSVAKAVAAVNVPNKNRIASNSDKLAGLFPNLYPNKNRRR